MDPITLRRELHCRATPGALWGMLADAEALLRGLEQVALPHRPVEGDGDLAGAVEFYSERAGQRYFELPAEWRSGQSLLWRRQYPKGPLAALHIRFTLTPVGQTSRLEIALSLWPRRPVWRFLLRLYGALSLRHLVKTLTRFDAALFRGENPTRVVSPLEQAALAPTLAAASGALSDDERQTLDKLIEHLRGLDDLDTQRLQPFALAEAWEQPKERLLSVCLFAAAHGLLDLRWEVLCKNCRLPARRYENLAQLVETVVCPRCAIEIRVDFETTLQAAFDLASALKPVPVRQIARRTLAYAASNPARTPHILVELPLPAPGRVTLQVPSEPGEYRLFLRGGAMARLNVSPLGPQNAQLVADSEIRPAAVEVAMGGTLEIAHEHAQPRSLQLARIDWPDVGAAAHTVTLHPRFRRHFGSGDAAQRLPPNLLFPVAAVALWQTELLGTLELGKRAGEQTALLLVREHLELLSGLVEREQGSLVRCSQDGIVAAFSDGVKAARVALLAQQAFNAFVLSQEKAHGVLGLRIGLFSGPCHLCSLVGALEYFGTTELVCLRLLREAHAGDIMLAAELFEKLAAARSADPGAGDVPPWKIGPIFALSLRGVDAPLPVVRMRID